jgi:hypothetical protein
MKCVDGILMTRSSHLIDSDPAQIDSMEQTSDCSPSKDLDPWRHVIVHSGAE